MTDDSRTRDRNSGAEAGFGAGVEATAADEDARTADADARLMAAFVATRDRRMFQTLFDKHHRAIVAFVARTVRNAARAEELTQDVFVRVYTTKSYTPDAPFRTWLYRVAANVCLNEIRRPERRRTFVALDQEDAEGRPRELPAPDGDPSAKLEERQLADRLERALAALPEKQRLAFLMVRYEGLTHEEIARALDTSVSAVKSLVHRALEALRLVLAPEGAHP